MRILDNSQNSGRSVSTKVVGTPRFELGTPCTPCEQSLVAKSMSVDGNAPSIPSRNDVGSTSVRPCLATKALSNSGRVDWQFLQGLGIVSLLVFIVACAVYWARHPEPHAPVLGSFHCDQSWRLPCDGSR